MTDPVLIPLHHYATVVGYALVDAPLGLDPRWLWRLEIPRAHRLRRYTADVTTELLRSASGLLERCTPIITLNTLVPYNVRLARVVLRPALVPLLNDFVVSTPAQKELLRDQVRTLSLTVGRTVFLSRSRVDCRLENLREGGVRASTPVEPSDPLALER